MSVGDSPIDAPANIGAGTQPAGVLHTLRLDGDGGASAIEWNDVVRWKSGDGYLWIHLDFESAEVAAWLRVESGLNDIAVEALVTPETRPRTLNRGDNLLLTLRGINHNPGDEPEDMISLRIWTDGERLISTRRRSLRSTESILCDLRDGHGPTSAAGRG